ncbi:MAG: S41 family peptidase [Bacteriovoracia bacterium]
MRYSILLALGLLVLSPVSSAQPAKGSPEKKAPQLNSAQRTRFEQLELFNKVLYLVENQYYRQVDTEKLIEGALKGMMETLDPHSSFLNKEFFQKMQNDTAGEFGGLGLEVTSRDGAIVVITPIEDSPAFRAGIQPRDRIVEINGESIVGLGLDQAIKRMHGKNGETIKLGIAREGEDSVKVFKLKREIIKVNPVKAELVQETVAYVRLTQFQKRAASAVEEALKKLTEEAKKNGGLSGIILDLRSNPGGLLDQAVDVSSLFLKEGIVVSTEARDPQNKDIRYVKKQGWKDLTTPLAILINGASASASEIVAGAIQDHARGPVVGVSSFGKGSVQTVAQLDAGTGVKLTIAQYLTPKGRRIQGLGIYPDITLDELDPKAFESAKRADRYVRERDLRNHLTATVETAEEKKDREEREKRDRDQRAQAIEKRRKEGKKVATEKEQDDDEMFRILKASEDYQVQQTASLLKTIKFVTPKSKP